jgi:hypothetical protein
MYCKNLSERSCGSAPDKMHRSFVDMITLGVFLGTMVFVLDASFHVHHGSKH